MYLLDVDSKSPLLLWIKETFYCFGMQRKRRNSHHFSFLYLWNFSSEHMSEVFLVRNWRRQIWKCRDMARLVLELLIYSAKIKTCHFQNQSLANFPISCPCHKKACYSKSSRKAQLYLKITLENSSPIKNNIVLYRRPSEIGQG